MVKIIELESLSEKINTSNMANFQQSWANKPSTGIGEQIHGMVKKEGALKPRIENSIRVLNQPIAKLDGMERKLEEKDARLFQRIVQAQQNRDKVKSTVLANELAEIRKQEKMVARMRLSLEQVKLRLSTVTELGDVVTALGPAMSAMKSMKPALAQIMPEADAEFASMGETLGGLMSNTFEGEFDTNVGSSEETDLILQEAAAVAGEEVGSKFPSVPVEIGNTESSSELY